MPTLLKSKMSRVNVQPNPTVLNPIPVTVNLVMDLQRILGRRRITKVLSFWPMNTSLLLALVNLLMLSGLSILVLVLIFA